MRQLIATLFVFVAGLWSLPAFAYECRIPESAFASPASVLDWQDTGAVDNRLNVAMAVLIWDRFGPAGLATLSEEMYSDLVFCAKKSDYNKCKNKDSKLHRALKKRQFEKLPQRPPANFLQHAGQVYGHCFGDRNEEVPLPATLFYTDNLTIAQCDAMLDTAKYLYDTGDKEKNSIEIYWHSTYGSVEKWKYKTACKYIPTSIVERHADVLDRVIQTESSPELITQIAREKQAAYCHPALTKPLDKYSMKSGAGYMASEAAAALDPGNYSVTKETVQAAFTLYVANNLGPERFFDLYHVGEHSSMVRYLRRCFAAEGEEPSVQCGMPNNPELYRQAKGTSNIKVRNLKPMEKTFSQDFGPETLAFLEANLGSCVLEPGRLKTREQVAAEEYATSQQPRPAAECWAVAGTIQSFIDNPGFHYSSSGESYERRASTSERAWLERWQDKVAAGNPQCVNDYPKRILIHAEEMQRQRMSAAAADARYMESQRNRPATADEVFQSWFAMHGEWLKCVEAYGSCEWVEKY